MSEKDELSDFDLGDGWCDESGWDWQRWLIGYGSEEETKRLIDKIKHESKSSYAMGLARGIREGFEAARIRVKDKGDPPWMKFTVEPYETVETYLKARAEKKETPK